MKDVNLDLFWIKVDKKSKEECWEWNASCRPNGYGIFKTKSKNHSSHRLSYELAYGEILDKDLKVCHSCDNRKCVNPNHLFLGTQSENMKDCYLKGRTILPEGIRFKKGNLPVTRITSQEIAEEIYKEINKKRLNKEKLNLREISIRYNIPYESIRDISCGRTYIKKGVTISSAG
jgi:hypothetical protein